MSDNRNSENEQLNQVKSYPFRVKKEKKRFLAKLRIIQSYCFYLVLRKIVPEYDNLFLVIYIVDCPQNH